MCLGEAVLVAACNQQQVGPRAPSKVFEFRKPLDEWWEQAVLGHVCSALCEICSLDPVVDGDRGVCGQSAHRDFRMQELKGLVGRFDRDSHIGGPNPESAQTETSSADSL